MQPTITPTTPERASVSEAQFVTGAEIDLLAFQALIEEYETARKLWILAYDDEKGSLSSDERAAFARFMSLELKVLSFPCVSSDLAARKASYILANVELRERTGGYGNDKRLSAFLSSLLHLKGGAA